MTDKDDGGPAFPACNEANVNDTMGMSLRDWYAGMALQGLLTIISHPHSTETPCADKLSKKSYEYADAMIEARGK